MLVYIGFEFNSQFLSCKDTTFVVINTNSGGIKFAKNLIVKDEQGEQVDIPEWEQPDSTNPYMTGDKVRFEGKVYQSLIDNNVWSPTAYPQGWEEVTEVK